MASFGRATGGLSVLLLGAAACTTQYVQPFDPPIGQSAEAGVIVTCGADGGVRNGVFVGSAGVGQPQVLSAPVQSALDPPPPISGGTLTILGDGKTAVAADPDRDLVYLIDLGATTLRTTIALMQHDEPGRVVEDGSGRVHVVLRRAGAVVSIDPVAGTVLARRPVCAAPRGIAYEAATDRIHIACLEGWLVSLPAAGGPMARAVQLPDDLRDVVVDRDNLLVSRFRAAEVLTVAADGHLAATTVLPAFTDSLVARGQTFTPSMAWRMRPARRGGAYVVHQRGISGPILAQPGGYGGGGFGCADIVHAAVTYVSSGQPTAQSALLAAVVLPVDLALTADESRVAVIGAGNSYAAGTRFPLYLHDTASLLDRTADTDCSLPIPGGEQPMGEAVAVAVDGNDRVVVQTREPATLQIPELGTVIPLSNRSRADTGHAIFHAAAGANIACASCHAEGQEDGRVWSFACQGPRRTQSLGGGISGRAPYHWDGALRDFPALVAEVYTGRMLGTPLNPDQMGAALSWIDSIPRLPPIVTDPEAVARGQVLFEDTAHIGCASCHAGAKLTTDAVVDVGTGRRFKVPSLVGVGWRAPFLHNGCAPTLADRFGSCGGGDQHGVTSGLAPSDVSDLVAYLKTL